MAFDLGKLFGRNEKNMIRRQMIKAGATSDEIDHEMFCMDNKGNAMAIFAQAISDMADYGAKIVAKMNYTADGIKPSFYLDTMSLTDMDNHKRIKNEIEDNRKKNEQKRSDIQNADAKATKAEEKIIEKIEGKKADIKTDKLK